MIQLNSEKDDTAQLAEEFTEAETIVWSRKEEFKESVLMLLSHHSPSQYGHCLRISFRGHSLYFCGRCSGIYGGLFLGIPLLTLSGIPLEPSWMWFLLAVALGITTVADWISQRITPRKTTVRIRFGTGLMSGIGLAIVFLLGNLVYMLITLGIMGISVGIVNVFETRKRSNNEVP